MNISDVDNFARKNGINLSEGELDFLFRFIKRNYEALYANPDIDLSRYKDHFSEENFDKIVKLVKQFKSKYAGFLRY